MAELSVALSVCRTAALSDRVMVAMMVYFSVLVRVSNLGVLLVTARVVL